MKVIHVDLVIRKDDGTSISLDLQQKIVRKLLALLKRLGCTPHGSWRLGEPPEVEDRLG